MDYTRYSVNDFVDDEFFWQWVLNPDEKSITFWENWLRENPHRAGTVDKAREIVLQKNERKHTLPENRVKAIWENIQSAQTDTPVHPLPKYNPQKKPASFPFWTKIAASVALIMMVAAAFWFFNTSQDSIIYATNYGETKTLVLPDSSVVTLNANSKLSIAAQWDAKEDRHVQLEGEAFFEVTHNDTRFMVHTEDLTVEVLGTEFNVNNRRSKTQVVLNSGKIRLNLERNNKEDLLMQPGDLAEFSKQSGQLLQKNVNPEVHSSWRNNTLIFDGTPLSEVAQMLEDNYGLKVEIKDQTLSERRLTGEIASTELDMFLNTLPALLDIKLTRNGKKLILENR